MQNVALPAYLKRFMGFIPYAALGALIFPGVLTSTGASGTEAAMAGCLLGGIMGAFLMNVAG